MNSRKLWFAAFAASFSVVSASAATLPTATEIFNKMGFGINIGNTMEVPGNPTGWGNKFPTEAYIDSVKAAGFSTIRIPCDGIHQHDEDGGGGDGGDNLTVAVAVAVLVINCDSWAAVQTGVGVLRCLTLCG